MKKWWIIGLIAVVIIIILGIYFYPKNPQEKCKNLCSEMKTNGVEEWRFNIVDGTCITYDNAAAYFNVSKSYLTGTHITPCDENTICVCVLDDDSFRGIG